LGLKTSENSLGEKAAKSNQIRLGFFELPAGRQGERVRRAGI
jgi:hypothetical protein